MKKITFIISSFIALAGVNSFAATNNKKSQECIDEGVVYQPGGRTLQESLDSFKIEMEAEILSCAFKEKVSMTKNQSLYIQGYNNTQNGIVVSFDRFTFGKQGFAIKEEYCSVTIRYMPTEDKDSLLLKRVVEKPSCVVKKSKSLNL